MGGPWLTNETEARNRSFAQALGFHFLFSEDSQEHLTSESNVRTTGGGQWVLLPGEFPGVFLQLRARNLLPFQTTCTVPPWGLPLHLPGPVCHLLPVLQPIPGATFWRSECQTLTKTSSLLFPENLPLPQEATPPELRLHLLVRLQHGEGGAGGMCVGAVGSPGEVETEA